MTDDAEKTRREIILGTVGDLATRFLYYARKEDDDLPVGAIEEAVQLGEITAEEIGERFTDLVRGACRRGNKMKMTESEAQAHLYKTEEHEGNDLSDNDKVALRVASAALETLRQVREHAADIDPADLSLGFGVFVEDLQHILEGR